MCALLLLLCTRGLSSESTDTCRCPGECAVGTACSAAEPESEAGLLASLGGRDLAELVVDALGDRLAFVLLVRGDEGSEGKLASALMVLYSSVSAFMRVITDRMPDRIYT